MQGDYSLPDILERLYQNQLALETALIELMWALVVLTLYSSGSDPPALEVLIHLFQ